MRTDKKILLTMCLLNQLNAVYWKVETMTSRFIANPDSASEDANTLSLILSLRYRHMPKRVESHVGLLRAKTVCDRDYSTKFGAFFPRTLQIVAGNFVTLDRLVLYISG